jgi:hypothetical protein
MTLPRTTLLLAVAWAAVPSPAPTAEVDREAAVLEAVFRQQLEEHLDAAERARGTVLCLGMDPGGAPQSPPQAVMARLERDPSVRRMGECEPRPNGAVEERSLRPAIIVVAGPIEWIADDEAHVSVSYFRSAVFSALRKYRVVRDRTGWVCLGQIILYGPVARGR